MARTKGARNKRGKTKEVIYPNTNETETQTPVIPETEINQESASTGDDGNVSEPVSSGTTSEANPQSEYEESLKNFDDIIAQAKANAPASEPIAQEKRGRRSKNEVQQDKIKVPGRLFALMNDRLLANGLSIIDTFTNKNPATLFPAQWLMMSDKDLDELAPIAQAAAAQMGVEEHPAITMYGMILSNQLSQFLQIKALIRQEIKRNPNFDVTDLKKPG